MPCLGLIHNDTIVELILIMIVNEVWEIVDHIYIPCCPVAAWANTVFFSVEGLGSTIHMIIVVLCSRPPPIQTLTNM